MATKTITRAKASNERPYDCLYDETYIASKPIQIVDPSMYHKQPLYRPKNNEKNIKTTNTEDIKPNLIIKREKIASQPGDSIIEGANRYKYGHQYGIEQAQLQFENKISLTSVEDAIALYTSRKNETPRSKDFGMQTDYRESEAQTDPYSPEFRVTSNVQPEILTLTSLSYGRGLPAGLAEVEMIERARSKRRWEASLPPLSDPTQYEKRKQMMEEREREEWKFREKEIEKLQQMKFNVMLNMLKEREEQNKENNTTTLKNLWELRSEQKQVIESKSKKNQDREIRKLAAKCTKVEKKYERRDVVRDYADFGSQVFAPLTRIGQFLDKPSKNKYSSSYLESNGGLIDSEEFLFASSQVSRGLVIPQRKIKSSDGYVKRKDKRLHQLDEIYQEIQNKKNQKEVPTNSLKYLKPIEKTAPRPTTPTIDFSQKENDDLMASVTQLQSLIRGRSCQNEMLKDAELRKDLISEVRSTHALDKEGKQQIKQQEMLVKQLQLNKKQFEEKEEAVDAIINEMAGTSLSDVLDFLSKELIRLEDEQKVHAFGMLADRQRAMREAEEAGLRQREEAIRKENDEIFRQVMNVHQATIETYLEDIILSSAARVADLNAREEIQKKAKEIDAVAKEMEATNNDANSELIVSELVHEFLLPQVERQILQEKVTKQQRLNLQIAHDVVYDHFATQE